MEIIPELKSEVIDVDEKIFILAKSYQAIVQYFAHWIDSDISKDDLDTEFRSLVHDSQACSSRVEFAAHMWEFLAKFRNQHTWYTDPVANKVPDIGFKLDFVDNEWIVIDSFFDDFEPGDKFISISGKPIETWYAELEKYFTGNKDRLKHV